jgi:hypothetical protein
MINRETNPNIISLDQGQIFVFGSNTAGRHGKGAAKTALKWGAVYGQATGLQGRTYGIPTVNKTISNKLPIDIVKDYIDDFIMFATMHPEYTFLVTEIGCGLAGFTVKQIAPLFKKAVDIENIHLPAKFWRVLCTSAHKSDN